MVYPYESSYDDQSYRDPDPLVPPASSQSTVKPHVCGKGCYFPARYVLAFWSAAGLVNMFTLRVDLNLALIEMVKEDDAGNQTQGNHSDDKFDWSRSQENLALGAFFMGYCATQILGGLLSGYFGGKRILGTSVLVTSLLALATPVSANTSFVLLVVCRVGQGLAQGLGQPCMHSMWTQWAPICERSKLLTISFAGCQLGSIIATVVTGCICAFTGWPIVFYFFGGAGLLWTVGWFSLIYDKPSQHPRISPEELKFITENLSLQPETKRLKIPWFSILTCPRFLAIVAAHFATDWGTFAVINYMPSFLSRGLKFHITQNAYLSSLPSCVLLVISPMSGFLADLMRSRKMMSTKATRKFMNSLGLFIPCFLMIGVCQVDDNRYLIISLMTMAIGFTGFTLAGYSVNHIDIAPPFAGLLFGLTNTVGTTTGFLGPVIVNAVVHDQTNLAEWRVFFYITAGVFFVGGFVFLLLAGGEPETWALPPNVVVHSENGEANKPPAEDNAELYDQLYDDLDWQHLWHVRQERLKRRYDSGSSFSHYGSLY